MPNTDVARTSTGWSSRCEIRLRLSPKALTAAAVKVALRRGGHLEAGVGVGARDAAGHSPKRTVTIRLRD